jgi:hypothetical protein
MLRTAFLVGGIAASLLLPTTVLNARGGGHGGGGHGGGGHGGGGGAVHVDGGGMHMGGGRAHIGGAPGVRVVGGGGGRHFWHGRWYAYGVGPCWQLAPGGYVWICG